MTFPGKTRDVLNVFDKFQGQIISTIHAEEIQNIQQEIIKNSFSQGFKSIHHAMILPCSLQSLL